MSYQYFFYFKNYLVTCKLSLMILELKLEIQIVILFIDSRSFFNQM